MATPTKIKSRAGFTKRGRALCEWSASAPSGSPLTVDRDKRVIYGVRVLGRFSRNSHGLREAANGTEYTRACMEQALPLYEGADVLSGHEVGAKRSNGGNDDVLGVLRNVRLEGAGDEACIRADLHYFDTHDLTRRVLEDVERGLGVFGLSHDARAGRERFDPASRRLVIESLAAVKSVDLVRKPATNRNLWESLDVPTTLRQLLEERRPKWSKARRAWSSRLLEDDSMAPMMDAPVEAPASSEPDDALKAGILAACAAACQKCCDGEMEVAECVKKIKEILTAHDKIAGSAEPEEPVKEEAEMKTDDKKSDDDKTESTKELARLKHQLAVRDLADEYGVKGDKTLLESLEDLPLDKARKLLEREKARGGQPRSSGLSGGTGGKPPGKPPGSAKEFADSIKD